MEYLVFPFGKYKGVKLQDLPSTYIVLALEKFELPEELRLKMSRILLGRFRVYSQLLYKLDNLSKKEFRSLIEYKINNYEKNI